MILSAGAIGCTPPEIPILLCHNGNCAEGSPPSADDTIAALRASLALRTADGRSPIDGLELDSVWDRARGGCTYGHTPDAGNPDFADAVNEITSYLSRAPAGTAAHSGDAFFLKIELKVDVGGGAHHTADEVAAHAACVTAAENAAIAAGRATGNPVTPIFDSDEPTLLAAIETPAFRDGADRDGIDYKFETEWGSALPAGFLPQIFTVGWFDLPSSLVWVDHGLLIWARDPSLADLSQMLNHAPMYLNVNNVLDARGFLDAQ
ncbi:MAG TPA: hypothetical protein VFP84_14590 [Kofleriaceae bacterium]|nr:hypothetical protein [Kofleriaceae bacterium]